MISDVLTKESVPALLITGILDNGVLNKDVFYGVKEVLDYSVLNNDVSNSVPNKGVLNKDVFYGLKEVIDYSVLNNEVSNSVLNKDVLYDVLDSDAFNDRTGEQKEAKED